MEPSAWAMLGVAIVLIYGGLAWGIIVAVQSGKK